MTVKLSDPKHEFLEFETRTAGDPDLASQGKLIILLHGFPESSASYSDILPLLANAGYFAFAYDQRGYSPGARPSEVEDYQILNAVSDVVRIAEQLGAESFHLVGHDWGGAVAWIASALYPDRIKTVTSLATPHPDALNAGVADVNHPQHEKSAYMEVFRGPDAAALFIGDASNAEVTFRSVVVAGGIPEAQAEEYAKVLGSTEACEAALNWYRANELPADVRIGAVKVPTLFIFGEQDIAFAKETAIETASLVDAPYTYIQLPNEGHWIPEAAPELVAGAIIELLARNR